MTKPDVDQRDHLCLLSQHSSIALTSIARWHSDAAKGYLDRPVPPGFHWRAASSGTVPL